MVEVLVFVEQWAVAGQRLVVPWAVASMHALCVYRCSAWHYVSHTGRTQMAAVALPAST